MSSASPRKRVVIIGGGPSSLTAAYWLTSTPELRAQYELTVYQMGWRLGGKGASGRNREQADRIEEHGLHIIFGFYQNFFAMIREVYGALGRKAGAPLATWREAFHPLATGVMEDKFRDRWEPWVQLFPRNREVPGRGTALNGPLDYLLMLGLGVLTFLVGWPTVARWQDAWFPTGEAWEQSTHDGAPEPSLLSRLFLWLVDLVLQLCSAVDRFLPFIPWIADTLYSLVWRSVHALVRERSGAHRLWTGIDVAVSAFRGIVRDRLYRQGNYAKIDRWDFRDWLVHHGAHETTKWSPYVRAIYDAAFSYDDGDPHHQQISASVALRTLVRMILTYKGAIYYKMQAGMGDTVFGPMYEVLKARGVTFRFFHKASALRLDATGTRIASVEFEQQAELLNGDPTSYRPMYDVGGLPSWPSAPLYEQLKDADRLRGIDLESYYSGYHGVGTVTLEAGRDFDTVLLGTPVQTLPFLCAEPERWSPRWRTMMREVKAVQTLSFQVWLSKDTASLGWPQPALPLLSLYVQPYNTWSDMSQVLKHEQWPANAVARSVQYFTGAQVGPDQCPPAEDRDFPERMTAQAKAAAFEFLRRHFTTLMPKAAGGDPAAIDWSLLVAVDPSPVGPARFETQYWRSNCDPHERCTVALPGTGQYRMAAGDTGVANLVITGDWIDNGIHVACLEGSVMGGIYAARAVSGVDFPIVGEMLNGSIFGR